MEARLKLFSRSESDESVVFIGEPGSLSGDVWLENLEAYELELRRAGLFSPNVRPTELTPTDRVTQIPIPRHIRAHQRQLLSVSFDLDRSTPPGTYSASIVVEGAQGTATFPAQIVVTQNYALSIEPDQLVVSVPPGGTFDGEVVVVNEGNVPIDVVPLGEFPLADPWREPRCCCGCHEKDDEREAEAERDAADGEADFGVIAIDNERTSVEPGASTLIRFVARLPEGLPANTHLRAKPRIGIERFSLDVITASDDRRGSDVEPRTESTRKRSAQKKKRS